MPVQGAAETLGRIGDTRAIPVLVEALGSTEPTIAHAASQALGGMGRPAVKPILERGLNTPAINALGRIGPEASAAVPLLGRLASRDNLAAIRALGLIGRSSMTPTLIDRLASSDELVRGAAAEALGRIGSGAAVDRLRLLARSDPADFVRSTSNEALRRIAAARQQGSEKARR